MLSGFTENHFFPSKRSAINFLTISLIFLSDILQIFDLTYFEKFKIGHVT